MSTSTDTKAGRSRIVPLRHTLPGLLQNPMAAFERLGLDTAGEVTRLNLGLFRPVLVTEPADVQRVLRDNASNYARDGMFWKPVRRLLGDGILADGPQWAASRKVIQPQFTSVHVDSLIEQMIEVVTTAVDAMARRGASGRPLNVVREMTRITHGAVIRVFFGDRIPPRQGHRVAAAIDVAGNSVNSRLLLPFVPNAIPLPGDLAFNRAVQTIDDVIIPLVRRVRRGSREGTDIVASLCRAYTEGSDRHCERRIRDDVVSMFSAASETTAMTLTWFWIALSANPGVRAQVAAEVADAVGGDPLTRAHLSRLRATKAAMSEVLRLYPPGWIIPRTAVAQDDLGGVRVERGQTVLLSPYLTHRMPSLWDRPHAFDPSRFSPEHTEPRHRYAYFPFSGGPHQCLGSHFFTIEAQIIVASILQRVTPEVRGATEVVPRVGATLRPRQNVAMVLRPNGGA